jgi:hypothetical protein
MIFKPKRMRQTFQDLEETNSNQLIFSCVDIEIEADESRRQVDLANQNMRTKECDRIIKMRCKERTLLMITQKIFKC